MPNHLMPQVAAFAHCDKEKGYDVVEKLGALAKAKGIIEERRRGRTARGAPGVSPRAAS